MDNDIEGKFDFRLEDLFLFIKEIIFLSGFPYDKKLE